jgi:hypothetical protein
MLEVIFCLGYIVESLRDIVDVFRVIDIQYAGPDNTRSDDLSARVVWSRYQSVVETNKRRYKIMF